MRTLMSGVNLSQDVPPLRWDVPPDIEKVGRPSPGHPPLKVWDGGCIASGSQSRLYLPVATTSK